MSAEWRPPELADPSMWRFQGIETGEPPQGELPPPRNDPTLRRSLPPRKTDLLGRAQPRRLTLPGILMAIPGAAARVRRVPARAISEEGVEDGAEYALLGCPCGAKPVVGESWDKCDCERAYVTFGGGRVFVFYLDMEPPQRS